MSESSFRSTPEPGSNMAVTNKEKKPNLIVCSAATAGDSSADRSRLEEAVQSWTLEN